MLKHTLSKGTGTKAGDLAEVTALKQVFKATPESLKDVLFLGSVKSVIGHTEGAAGLCSLIKVVECMRRGQLPPNSINEAGTNPALDLASANIVPLQKPQNWTSSDGVLQASVNSFGYGGTIAHAVLQSTRSIQIDKVPPSSCIPKYRMLPVMTDSPGKKAFKWVQSLVPFCHDANEGLSVDSLFHTFAKRLSSMDYLTPIIVFGRNWSEIGTSLADITASDTNSIKMHAAPNTMIWIFTGQGAQWPTMGAVALDEEPRFSSAIDALDKILQSLPDPPTWTIRGRCSSDLMTCMN